jgi:pimeloyl-ACP methyl ester carboxylesterase
VTTPRAVLLAVSLLLGTVACTGQPVEPAPTGARARWTACDDEAAAIAGGRVPTGFRFSCAAVRVPHDWARPDGETFTVALIRVRAENQSHRIGSLLVNPGGPGAPGVDLAVQLAPVLPAEVTRRFDVVGFDPRGVGRSAPVDCIPDRTKDALAAADPDPETRAGFDALVALWREAANRCDRRYGDRLRLYSTEQAARDLDAVRAAVGDPKTTYLGYSYGSLLGAVHAHLFPTRLRAVVLDGALDPTASPVESTEQQAVGFERAFGHFAADCRRRGSGCPVSPGAAATLRRVLTEVADRPLRVPGGRLVTEGHVITGVVAALYTESAWTTLARALADAEAGRGERILRLADEYNQRRDDGTYTDILDANTAVTCVDHANPPTPAEVRRLQLRWRDRYPFFGAALASSLLACAVWPAEHDPYPVGPARGSPPILVVGTTGDPATPYDNTPRLARLLGSGVVLTWDGEGHTAYPRTRCVNAAIDRYLLELQVPPPGATCPAR